MEAMKYGLEVETPFKLKIWVSMQMVCVKDITSAKNMVIEKMFHNRSVYVIENYTEAYKKITMFKIVF